LLGGTFTWCHYVSRTCGHQARLGLAPIQTAGAGFVVGGQYEDTQPLIPGQHRQSNALYSHARLAPSVNRRSSVYCHQNICASTTLIISWQLALHLYFTFSQLRFNLLTKTPVVFLVIMIKLLSLFLINSYKKYDCIRLDSLNYMYVCSLLDICFGDLVY